MAADETVRKHRSTARLIGALFLVATASYLVGSGLVEELLRAPDFLTSLYLRRTQLTIGVLLQFVDVAAVVGIGVLLFPIMRVQSEAIALGYAGARLLEGVFLGLGGINTLSLISLSQHAGTTDDATAALGALLAAESQTAFLVAMIALGVGSLPFCYVLIRARLVPRTLALLGLVGYAALLAGSVLELVGIDLGLVQYIPGGLFELVFPLWLIACGIRLDPAVDSAPIHR